MGVTKFLNIILVTFVTLKGCHATYQFDLFQSVGISGNPTIPGLTVTRGSPFVDFSKYSGSPIVTDSTEVGFISHAFMNSDDISFAVQFIIDKIEKGESTFFAIENNNVEYLKISLSFQGGGAVEGQATGKVIPVLKLRRVEGASTATKEIGLQNHIEVGKEVTLIVRFQNVGASNAKRKRRATHTSDAQNIVVSVNCKVVHNDSFPTPFFGKSNEFPLSGRLTVGMSISNEKASNVFPGKMNNPVLLTNKLAFEILNPCTTLPSQDVPSEPLPNEYDASFFEKFVKMTSLGLTPVILDCVEKGTNKRRYSGEVWYERGICLKKTCRGGVIETSVACLECKIGKKTYYTGETFTRPSKNPCNLYECALDWPQGRFKENLTETCEENLKCDSNGEIKLETECCKKCTSDKCTDENTVYTENCRRNCGDNECATKTFGCYCKTGYVLDESGNCIKESDCTCKVDSKVYQPKERVQKSRYEECICLRGKLECSTSQP